MVRKQPTREELAQMVRAAYAEVAKCRTVEELRQVWVRYYYDIGHKALARMLLGWEPEEIIRKIWRTGLKEE